CMQELLLRERSVRIASVCSVVPTCLIVRVLVKEPSAAYIRRIRMPLSISGWQSRASLRITESCDGIARHLGLIRCDHRLTCATMDGGGKMPVVHRLLFPAGRYHGPMEARPRWCENPSEWWVALECRTGVATAAELPS